VKLRLTEEQKKKLQKAREAVKDLENEFGEMAEPGRAYLMRMAGTHFFKIGHSHSPTDRARQLQTGNPYKLELIAESVPVDDSKSLEDDAHEKFRAYGGPEKHGGKKLATLVLGDYITESALTEWFWLNTDEKVNAVKAFLQEAQPKNYAAQPR